MSNERVHKIAQPIQPAGRGGEYFEGIAAYFSCTISAIVMDDQSRSMNWLTAFPSPH